MLPDTLIPCPVGAICTRRRYIKHRQQHVLFLERHYHVYTLKELEALLGIPWQSLKKLAEREGIRKRAPNGTRWCDKPYKEKGHIPQAPEALA